MIRAFASGLRLHLLHLLRSPFDLIGMLVWPVVFASIAYYLIGIDGSADLLLSASLGAAVMMMWSQVIVGSGFALDSQRIQGTLELLVAAPMPLAALMAPIMIASGTFGLYGLLVTLVWGRFAFGIPFQIDAPFAFVAATGASIVAIGLLGLIAVSTFVLYRAAFYLGVALQYPVYIACGLIVPFTVLPGWLDPISWLLAPTWGFRGLRDAAVGGDPWFDISMCLVLSAAYFVIALPCLWWFERLARDRATLKLA